MSCSWMILPTPYCEGHKNLCYLACMLGFNFLQILWDFNSDTNEEFVYAGFILCLSSALLTSIGKQVGISSGAAAAAALKVGKRPENAGKLIGVRSKYAYCLRKRSKSIHNNCTKNLIHFGSGMRWIFAEFMKTSYKWSSHFTNPIIF